MSKASIYNAVYRNKTKKDIYKAVMEHVDNLVLRRLSKSERDEQKILRNDIARLNRKIQNERSTIDGKVNKALRIQRKEIKTTLRKLLKKDDKLFTTKSHNTAIELAIRNV